MLRDRYDEARPLWWRQAIEDYLETAPPLVRFLAGARNVLREGKISLRTEELSAKPITRLTAKGHLTMEGSNYDGQYPRQRVASAMGQNDLIAVLWMVTSARKKPNGAPEEADFVIEVSDLSLGEARTVQTGLAGRRTLVRDVNLAADYRGIVRGEVTVTFEQVSVILHAEDGELQVLPAVELPGGPLG